MTSIHSSIQHVDSTVSLNLAPSLQCPQCAKNNSRSPSSPCPPPPHHQGKEGERERTQQGIRRVAYNLPAPTVQNDWINSDKPYHLSQFKNCSTSCTMTLCSIQRYFGVFMSRLLGSYHVKSAEKGVAPESMQLKSHPELPQGFQIRARARF